MKKKPNIVILYTDQHSARALGCYGNNEIHTPNLDRLAREGVTMDNAFCNNPICTPSRMCMLSGQYVHNFGYYGLAGPCPEHLPNLLDHLKRQGYTNAVIGKIHTPAGWVSRGCDYLADGYGFETPLTLQNRDQEEGCQGIRDDDYARYLEKQGLLDLRDDKILQEWYDKHGHAQGQCVDARPSRLDEAHSFEHWCADRAMEFLDQNAEGDSPFFLWLTLPRPHQTYCPAQEFWDLYDEQSLTLPPNAENDMAGRSAAAREKQRQFQEDDGWTLSGPKDFSRARRRVLRGYYACVTQSDHAIGRVLEHLDDLGLTDETILLYTTDHGEFAGEHGMVEKAPGIGFGCVTRVPMIWKYPGCPAGARRTSLIESVDILPTLCALAGLEAPNWTDGISSVKTLETDEALKTIAVTENPNTKTIHTKQYKLTQYLPEFHGGQDFGELFDRERDPWELCNLYYEEAYQDVVQQLRHVLYCWLVRTTRVVTVNPRIPNMDHRMDLSSGASWDLAEALGVWDEDRKVGGGFYQDMIDRGHRLYL